VQRVLPLLARPLPAYLSGDRPVPLLHLGPCLAHHQPLESSWWGTALVERPVTSACKFTAFTAALAHYPEEPDAYCNDHNFLCFPPRFENGLSLQRRWIEDCKAPPDAVLQGGPWPCCAASGLSSVSNRTLVSLQKNACSMRHVWSESHRSKTQSPVLFT
jgi:hypothetical protein